MWRRSRITCVVISIDMEVSLKLVVGCYLLEGSLMR